MAIRDSIELALDGARYHESRAFELAMPTSVAIDRDTYRRIVYYLRAYYWELWSVWDYILQNVNSQTLRLPEEKVNSRLVQRLADEAPGYSFRDDVTAIYDNPWLKRIARLRHSAHRWVLKPYQLEHTNHGVTVISLLMNDGDTPKQINIDRNDLWYMESVVQQLDSSGFFSNPS
jgi:sulfur relay (sulfurtransferase) DsrC/TusE family protein